MLISPLLFHTPLSPLFIFAAFVFAATLFSLFSPTLSLSLIFSLRFFAILRHAAYYYAITFCCCFLRHAAPLPYADAIDIIVSPLFADYFLSL